MNARERTRFDAIKRSGDFGKANATDLSTPIPPAAALTPAQTKAAGLFAALNTPVTDLIARISANATNQESGTDDFHGGTASKTVLRHALYLELEGLRRSAISIAGETGNPGLMDSFRLPHSVSDEKLAARARACGVATTPLATDFEALGHETTFLADLEAADTDQNNGEGVQTGATAGYSPLLGEGLDAMKTLDAIMHNFYKTDDVKLAAWRTASHVERQPKTKKQPTPASSSPHTT